MAGLILSGCASPSKVDWEAKVGSATYDEIVQELGPPERETKLSDDSRVADWLQKRGGSWFTSYRSYPDGFSSYGHALDYPDRLIRLTFDPQGVLKSWKTVYR